MSRLSHEWAKVLMVSTLLFFSYEKSETHRVEVPRMLQDDTASLEAYVKEKNDKCVSSESTSFVWGGTPDVHRLKLKHLSRHLPRNIYKWWAQYLESQSDMDSALHFYNLAEDYFSVVRVYCYMEDIQKVTECYGWNDSSIRIWTPILYSIAWIIISFKMLRLILVKLMRFCELRHLK